MQANHTGDGTPPCNLPSFKLPPEYSLHNMLPSIEAYLRLRQISGLAPRSTLAAERGLPNSFFSVCINIGAETIGIGRVIGDGALFLHIVDVAVDPAHQGRGAGKSIMRALMAHIESVAPAEIYVSLMANGEAYRLYEQFGFSPVTPHVRGMALWMSGVNGGREDTVPCLR
jgi:GNAT superfamily N-acetyltransferase